MWGMLGGKILNSCFMSQVRRAGLEGEMGFILRRGWGCRGQGRIKDTSLLRTKDTEDTERGLLHRGVLNGARMSD